MSTTKSETETTERTAKSAKAESDPSFWERNGDSIKRTAGMAAIATGSTVVAGVVKERVIDPLIDRGKNKAKEKAAESAANLFRRSGGGFFRR